MENRAEFRLGKRIFLGILGNLGSKIDPRDLSKKTRASGLNGHGKRGKIVRERREMSIFLGSPRILFIGRLNHLRTRGVRPYAARTHTSCMTEASTASASDGTGCWVRGSDGTAGRTGQRVGRVGASDGSDSSDRATWTIRGQSSRLRRAYRSTQRVPRMRTLPPLRIISEF